MKAIKHAALMITFALAAMLAAGCDMPNGNEGGDNSPAAEKKENGDDRNLSREDFERTRERFEKEAKELGRRVGDGADDLWIWTKTRAALAYADNLRDVTINVDVENNVVTLSGTVPDEAQKKAAEEIARSIEGVHSVKNEIRVSQPAPAQAHILMRAGTGQPFVTAFI
ncbi:MAG TPA: BON domain-containing protein [Blastocatellia bacterium]|nr:BON domain-containing protein [Blastocatellia bacterium]